MGLAIEQLDLVRQSHYEYVTNWFLTHNGITSLRVRTWAPRYLQLCGHHEQSRLRAKEVLEARGPNGLWQYSPAMDASAAYSLSQAECVTRGDLAATAGGLIRKLKNGAGRADIAYPLNSGSSRVLKGRFWSHDQPEAGRERAWHKVWQRITGCYWGSTGRGRWRM